MHFLPFHATLKGATPLSVFQLNGHGFLLPPQNSCITSLSPPLRWQFLHFLRNSAKLVSSLLSSFA